MNKIESENLIRLVIDAQNGDEKAFDELYRQTIKFAYSTANLLLSNEHDIEEALQNSYMYVAKSLCDLKEPEKFTYWLSVIVKHECQKYIAKQKKMSDVFFSIRKSEEFELPTESILPVELIEKNEVRDAIQKLVGKLPDDKRACVVLYYFEQHSLSDIAEILGVPEGTVKSRLYSARKILEKEFKKLQKKDDSLFGVSIIPLVTVLFSYQVKNIAVPHSISKGTAVFATATASAASATTAATGGTAVVAGATATSAATTVTAATGASAAASTAGAAVATKVAAVAVAASVAVSGGVATVSYVREQNEAETTMAVATEFIEEFATVAVTAEETTFGFLEIWANTASVSQTDKNNTRVQNTINTKSYEPVMESVKLTAESVDITETTIVTNPTTTAVQTTAERIFSTAPQTTSAPSTTSAPATTSALATTTSLVAEDSEVYSVSGGVLKEYTGNGGDVQIPSSIDGGDITAIGMGAFAGNTDITSVSAPPTVTRIGQEAFADCSNLESVSLPSSLQSIGIGAFCGCTSLTSASIPSGVITIGDDAFADCSSLKEVTIPSSVTSIGDNAFGGCDNLTIKCYEGSTAHDYAVENSINYEFV